MARELIIKEKKTSNEIILELVNMSDFIQTLSYSIYSSLQAQ